MAKIKGATMRDRIEEARRLEEEAAAKKTDGDRDTKKSAGAPENKAAK